MRSACSVAVSLCVLVACVADPPSSSSGTGPSSSGATSSSSGGSSSSGSSSGGLDAGSGAEPPVVFVTSTTTTGKVNPNIRCTTIGNALRPGKVFRAYISQLNKTPESSVLGDNGLPAGITGWVWPSGKPSGFSPTFGSDMPVDAMFENERKEPQTGAIWVGASRGLPPSAPITQTCNDWSYEPPDGLPDGKTGIQAKLPKWFKGDSLPSGCGEFNHLLCFQVSL